MNSEKATRRRAMRRAARARKAGRAANVEPVQSPASILSGKLLQKTCQFCGKPFTTPNPKRLHCSSECTRAHDNARRMERRARVADEKLTINWGFSPDVYNPHADDPNFESDILCNVFDDTWGGEPMDVEDEEFTCMVEHQTNPDKYTSPLKKVCSICGEVFVQKTIRQIYCSHKCAHTASMRKVRQKKKNTPQESIHVQQEQVVQTNNTIMRSVTMDEENDKMKRIEISAEYFRSAYLRLQEAYKAREDAKLFFEHAVKSGEKAGIYTWNADEGVTNGWRND